MLLVLLVSIAIPLAGTTGSSSTASPKTDDVAEGRLLIRGKPVLVYPATAPTRHQLIVGVGVPVQELYHSVVMGWVLKAQYYLPSVPGNYEPINLENWNDSRRAFPAARNRRAVERYEVDNVSIRVEPLPVEEKPMDDDCDGDLEEDCDELEEEPPQDANEGKPPSFSVPGSATDGYDAPNSRWLVYKTIEQLSNGYGFGGRVCMLRSICEASEAQFTHTGGVFAELLHIMFSPSTTNEPVSEHRDNEYFRAEQLGRAGAPCAEMFHECSTSLLDMFSGVHDLHSAASSFFTRSPHLPTDPVLSMR